MNLDEIYANVCKVEKEILNITLAPMGSNQLKSLKNIFKKIYNIKEELLLIEINEGNCLIINDVRQKILESELNIKIIMREFLGLDNSIYMYKLNKLVGGDYSEI